MQDYLDILAIGGHPDDVEIGVGGLLLRCADLGYKTGICDLTRGELGTRGTPEIRLQEAQAAQEILGVHVRRNLDLGDGRLELNIPSRHALARLIRELKPRFIVGPYPHDRHPDHVAAGMIMKYAAYDSRTIRLDLGWPPHTVLGMFYFPSHRYKRPSFAVDITSCFDKKMEAIKAYTSQFGDLTPPYPGYVFMGVPDFIFAIETRSRQFGAEIRVKYGEGFYMENSIPLHDPYHLLVNPPG